MKNETVMAIIAGAGVVSGIIGMCVADKCYNEVAECRKLLGDSEKRIRELSSVDIDQHIVNETMRKVVKEKAGEAVNSARRMIENDMSADLRNRVKQVIGNKSDEINRKVAEQLAKEMAEVDKDEITSQVIEATTEKLIDKLSDDLDKEVGKIGKVYKGIAAIMQ